MSDKNEEKLSAAVKSMMQIYLSLIFGLLIFLAVTITIQFLNKSVSVLDAELEYILSTTALLISIASIPLGYYLYSQKAKEAIRISNNDEKIEIYRSALILKLALFEVAGFFNLIVFYLSQNKQSLIVFALVITVFLINRPSITNYYNNFEK